MCSTHVHMIEEREERPESTAEERSRKCAHWPISLSFRKFPWFVWLRVLLYWGEFCLFNLTVKTEKDIPIQ